MTQEIQNEMDKLKKQINNPSIPDSLKNILRGKLAKLEESVEKTETQVAAIEKKEEQLEKKAEGDLSAAIEKMEKQIKNPSLPESLREQIKEKLKKAKANVVEVKKEQVEEKKIKEEKIKEVKEEVKETVKEVKKAIEKKSSPKEKEVEVKKAVTVSTEVIKKAKRVKEEASKQVVEKTKKRTTKLKGTLRELQAIINANPTLKVLYKGKGVDLKRDAARQAKPVGYRFKGKHNYRIPKNLDNPNVYYEGRPDKGDAYQNKRRGVYFADGGMMAKGGKLKYGQLYIDGKVETIFEPIIGYTLVEKGTGGEKFTVEIFKYPNYGGKGVRYYYYDSRKNESTYSNDLDKVKKLMYETLEKNNEKITKIKYEDRGGMADGGMMEKGGKINYSYTTAHGYTVYRGGKALESFKTEEQAKRFVKDLEKSKMHYADGGMMEENYNYVYVRNPYSDVVGTPVGEGSSIMITELPKAISGINSPYNKFKNKEIVIEEIKPDSTQITKAFLRETGEKVPFVIDTYNSIIERYADGGMMAKGGKLKYGQQYNADGEVETLFEPIIGYKLVEKGTGGETFTVEIFKYPNYGGKDGVRYYYYDSRKNESTYSNDLDKVKKLMYETLEKNNEKIKKINYQETLADVRNYYLKKDKGMADGGMTKERENLEEAYKRKLITKKEYEDEISKLMMPRSGAYGKKGISSSIREYYMNAFPTDDMGADINPNATFKGLLHTLDSGKEVYNYIGVYDSLVRERVFEKLSELTGLDYAVIYDKWLKTAADGGIMARGGKTSRYNEGLSWHQDHARHNSSEKYEVPVKRRKK